MKQYCQTLAHLVGKSEYAALQMAVNLCLNLKIESIAIKWLVFVVEYFLGDILLFVYLPRYRLWPRLYSVQIYGQPLALQKFHLIVQY